MNGRIRVALIGLGKIARDQHLPLLQGSAQFTLVATVSPNTSDLPVPHFPSLEALLHSRLAVEAVCLCQPPQFRYQAAALALRAGKHVLLEKPPGASTLEVEQLQALARAAHCTLFAAWHSRYAQAIGPASRWLASRASRSVRIDWREDVRHWHPGVAWIWEPGGLGVLDPGINALSIATRLIAEPLRLVEGILEVPVNRAMPVAAQLSLRTASEVPVEAIFDWRETQAQAWTLQLETDRGTLRLVNGGAELYVGEERLIAGEAGLTPEYQGLYAHFAQLIAARASEVDLAPLRIVADAFLRCPMRKVEAFL